MTTHRPTVRVTAYLTPGYRRFTIGARSYVWVIPSNFDPASPDAIADAALEAIVECGYVPPRDDVQTDALASFCARVESALREALPRVSRAHTLAAAGARTMRERGLVHALPAAYR